MTKSGRGALTAIDGMSSGLGTSPANSAAESRCERLTHVFDLGLLGQLGDYISPRGKIWSLLRRSRRVTPSKCASFNQRFLGG